MNNNKNIIVVRLASTSTVGGSAQGLHPLFWMTFGRKVLHRHPASDCQWSFVGPTLSSLMDHSCCSDIDILHQHSSRDIFRICKVEGGSSHAESRSRSSKLDNGFVSYQWRVALDEFVLDVALSGDGSNGHRGYLETRKKVSFRF